MTGIIRNPTPEESMDFTPLANATGNVESGHKAFQDKLIEEQQKAIKAKKPFCDIAAKDDYYGAIKQEAERQTREFGYVKDPINMPKIDWNKYSDLKNFTLLEEKEESEPANKHSPAKIVTYKVYKFKGYSNKYTVFD